MKTQPNTIASLLATVIWADGDFTEAERVICDEIAEALEISASDFRKYITAAVTEVQHLSADAATEYAVKHAAKVDSEEVGEVYQSLMQMALCDGVLTSGEIYNLMAFAEALDIDRENAVLMLCDLVKHEPELEISYEQDTED